MFWNKKKKIKNKVKVYAVCKNCKWINRILAQFCPECGESLKSQSPTWPQVGDDVYAIGLDGSIFLATYKNDDEDEYMLQSGNMFKTELQAMNSLICTAHLSSYEYWIPGLNQIKPKETPEGLEYYNQTAKKWETIGNMYHSDDLFRWPKRLNR